MKKYFLIIVLFLATIVTVGQNPWKGFWKPVTNETSVIKSRDIGYSVWLFRPTVGLSAIQFVYDKECKCFHSEAFSATGMGVGYQHYIDLNGQPYNNFGFNALVLFNATDPGTISLAGTVSALKFVSVGAGYNLGTKQVFFLTGVSYNF